METRKLTESYQNFGERLADHLGPWEKAVEGTDLTQLVLLEQFLQALPRVREEKPKTISEASEMADNYELARKAERGGAVQQQATESAKSVPATSKSGPPCQQPVSKPKTNQMGSIPAAVQV